MIDRLNAALVDRYHVLEQIGEGGMATVFLSFDLKHDRRVAIKVLRPDLAAVVGAERFLAEIKLTATLQHPNILPLFDSGTADGLLYYVMPYVRDETLRDRLDRQGVLPVDEAVAIARGIASALHHAHRQGVVHRDTKPENVLLSDGVPVVADFGIALAAARSGTQRVTAEGASIGTPDYMSPEQALGGEDVDRRSDVYSLGCVLYEMLTGEAPFRGDTAQAVMVQHLTAPIPSARTRRETVPREVDEAIMRALAKDRTERFDTAADMGDALVVVPPVEPLPDYSQVDEPVTRSTTPLAGRREEFAQLIQRLDGLAKGTGSLVLVAGEPGVGKTKLAEAVLLEARARGYVCSIGHCYEMDGAPPYLPFVEQIDYATRTVPPGRLRAVLGSGAAEIARIMPRLRQLFPDIGQPLDLPPDQQRHFLLTQFVEYFERATRAVPLVLLFDDLHWADESTLLLLEHLAQYLPRMPILALGTYRDVDLEVGRPFAKCLERLTRQRLADRIVVRRMPDSDVAELLAQLGGPEPPPALVKAIYYETEGNPFFVEEVFRHLRDEGQLLDAEGRWLPDLRIDALQVPEGVKLVIGRRLERVSDACRDALPTAAVIGPQFSLDLMEAVSGLSVDELLDALEEAERAGLIIARHVERKVRYSFEHELIRQTLLGGLSVPRRLRRHLKTAMAIEELYPGREVDHASELAYHYFQSGSTDEEKTTGYLLLAGRQALEAGAFDEALAQADRAFSVMDESGPRRRADLLWLRASALRGLGRWEAATASYEETIELLRSLDAETDLLAATCMLAEMLYWLPEDHVRGVDILDGVLQATPDVPSEDRARLLALAATLRSASGNFPEGKAMSDAATEMARIVGDPEIRGLVLSSRASLLTNAGHIADAVECAEGAVTLLRRTSKRWALLWAESRVVNSARFACLPREVLSRALASVEGADAVGHVGARLSMVVGRIVSEGALTPHVDQFDAAAEEFERDFDDLGTWRELVPLMRAWARFERGEDGAGQLLEGSADRFAFDAYRDIWWASEFATWAHEDEGKAREVLEANRHRIPVAGQYAPIGARDSLDLLVEGLLQLGEHDTVAALYPVCTESLALGVLGGASITEKVAGVTAAGAGNFEAAEGHFTAALELANEREHVAEQAGVRLSHARMLLERNAEGDAGRARTMLEEAKPMFEAAGRLRRLRECQELLGG
jgi:tetratricopeptide (TPR) repeat protein/tRNA A-37 threonylcarbamoyl transferase component Bud32